MATKKTGELIYLTPEAAAIKLGRSVRTLARWRKDDIGPKHNVTDTGSIVYFEEDLLEWLKGCDKVAEDSASYGVGRNNDDSE